MCSRAVSIDRNRTRQSKLALPKETVMEDHRNGSKITRTETQASGGSKEGVVRYVLIVGLVLVVIAFVVAYIFA